MKQVLNLLLVLCVYTATFGAFATTLPTSQDMQVAPDTTPIDPALASWFRDHAEVDSPLDLKPNLFQQYLKNQDDLTAAFLQLRYANMSGKNEKTALELSKNTIKLIQRKNDAQLTSHPIFPYLLQEIIESSKSSPKESAFAYEGLEKFGDRSCPRRDYILKELNGSSNKDANVEVLNKQLDKILYFKSKRFRKEALEIFLDGLTVEKQGSFRERLLPTVREYPSLLEDNTWLLGSEEEAAQENPLKEPFKSLRSIVQNAARVKCRTAKIDLLDLMKKYKEQDKFFTKFEQASLKVEECFARKGTSARETYWTQMEKPLEVAFGFHGGEIARRRIALLKWSRDDFKTARAMFIKIAEEAAARSEKIIEANALFTLARIEENDSRITESLAYYRKFAEKFPDSDRYLDAEIALVLLNFISKDTKAALANAELMIESQSKLALDKRNTGALSFALFWAGRLHYALNQKSLAREMWERVANEYYSTFYGAIGHYLLEKMDGKALVLSPSKTVAFNADQLYAKFDAADQPTIGRITALLKLGLKDDAICEIGELAPQDGESDRLLVKAMFQHASGEWLNSIKNFDALPRSFRNSLASGFERLLFPRAYEQSVHDYSKKIGMDPDLIFAIIRQESVFNPRASSQAGARGLMQLMPGTARLEATRLELAYLDRANQKRLKRSVENTDNLYHADTNIALGIHHVHRLLKKYQNPVFVLTSYNANPRATERWIQNLPTEDFLSFIERIPYGETRTYVKLVLRNYFYYKRWYKSPQPRMEHLESLAKNLMQVDPALAPN